MSPKQRTEKPIFGVFAKIKELKIAKSVRQFAGGLARPMGQGLTAEKMKSCIWVKPEDKLRHT
jgi:hypothetical protein